MYALPAAHTPRHLILMSPALRDDEGSPQFQSTISNHQSAMKSFYPVAGKGILVSFWNQQIG
jgi:hypothetical protein